MTYNKEAEKAYQKAEKEVLAQVEKLQARLTNLHDNAKDTQTINWAHVGDMNYILSQLKQLNGESND